MVMSKNPQCNLSKGRMKRLSKEDLAQMNRDYFQSLDKQKLVEVPIEKIEAS